MADDSEDVFESAQSPTHSITKFPTLNVCIDQQIPFQIFGQWAVNPECVSGLLLGKQLDCKVEVVCSIELKFKFGNQELIDEHYCEKAKQLFKDLEILGWYTIGNKLIERHVNLHYQICNITQCPIVLQLNAETGKTNIFGTVIATVRGKPTIKFVELPCPSIKNSPKIQTIDDLVRKNASTLDEVANSSKQTGSSLVQSMLASPSSIPSLVVSLDQNIVHRISLSCDSAVEDSTVIGILIGKKSNCNAKIIDSLCLKLESFDDIYSNIEKIISMREKLNFKQLDEAHNIVGWYTIGSKITEQDVKFHKHFRAFIKRSDLPEIPILMKICPQFENSDPNMKIYGTSTDTNIKNDEDNLLFFKLGVSVKWSTNQEESLTELRKELKKEKDRTEVYNKFVNPVFSTIIAPLILLFPTTFQIFVYIFFLVLFLYFIRHHIMKKLKCIRKVKH